MMSGVICLKHNELAEQPKRTINRLVAFLGLVVLSCLYVYCALVWPQCNGRPTFSSQLVMYSLAACAIMALAFYCRLSSVKALHTYQRYSVILLAAFLAAIVLFSYIDILLFSCPRIDPVVRGGHTVELLQDH